ncbi:hypothetical protein Tco_0854683 [Tanacetum coccineum]
MIHLSQEVTHLDVMRVKKLEHQVKSRQPRRRERVVIFDNEENLEDPSKQGRRIAKIDQNTSISLVEYERTSWIQEDVEIQGKTIITASATPKVKTAAENLVYIRKSAEKRIDKGKAIMKEDKYVQKKAKKQLEQERLGHEEAIRLQEQINEEERQRIARDAEIAKQLQEEFNRARREQEVIVEVDQAHDIDWRSSKKRSREDSDKDNAKKQKLEDDAKKEELRDSMDVVPRDDIVIDVESLATKYPIVDWKTHVLTENMMYYQIIKADGSLKNYKVFSEMLDDFDRQDVLDLHRLVQEMYDTTSPEGYDLLLWEDLKILFEPNEDDEI